MQLIIRLLLCVIDIFNKYGWVIPLKDKKDTTITNTFQNINEHNCKLDKTCRVKGSKLYNK